MTNRFNDLRTDTTMDLVDLNFTKLTPVSGSRFPRTEQAIIKAVRVKPTQTASQVKDLIFTTGTGELFEVDQDGKEGATELGDLREGMTIKKADGSAIADGIYLLPDGSEITIWDGKITQIVYSTD